MGDKSRIEWTDATWNPTTGCTKVSQGCKHCYAERFAKRMGYDFSQVELHPARLEIPLHWKKPRRIFVDSMSDLFHEKVPTHFIDQVFIVMARAEHHIFQVLTKRPQRMMEYILDFYPPGWVYENIWLGVSCEDQKTADERIPWLLSTPTAVRFVSCEPLLEEIDLEMAGAIHIGAPGSATTWRKLDWLICGGESGPGARPMHPDWARSIRDQCQAAGVPFFFKQWGEWWPSHPQYGHTDSVEKFEGEHPNSIYTANGETCLERDGAEPVQSFGDYTHVDYQPMPNQNPWWMLKTGKKAAGRLLDGREWNEYPLSTDLGNGLNG